MASSTEPYLIDLSLRGNPVGARIGQTRAELPIDGVSMADDLPFRVSAYVACCRRRSSCWLDPQAAGKGVGAPYTGRMVRPA